MAIDTKIVRHIANHPTRNLAIGERDGLREAADEIDRLLSAVAKLKNMRVPTLFPDKSDMPQLSEDAYRLAYETAISEVSEILNEILGEESA